MIVSIVLRLCFIGICLNKVYSCDTYRFTGKEYNDERDDSDVEANKTIHIVNWSGRLIRKVQDYTQLTVSWDHPVDGLQVCAYNLHYYKASDTNNVEKHYTVNVSPNVSENVIKGLDMGTSYHAYVEAVFDKPVGNGNRKTLRSWILITKTLGVGEDNPCDCTRQATVDNCVDCCNKKTGQCTCKDTFTFGQRCELCALQFYMDPELGCVVCDQCPTDGVAGDGSCKPDLESGMQCSCNAGYSGEHCNSCDVGFYKQNGVCIPCNCSGNQKITIKDFCNVEGQCLACDYHTAGDHCEMCYPGYVGNAFARTCHVPSRLGENFGIALATIAAILLGFLLLAVLLRQIFCRHRNQHTLLAGHKNCSNSAINFTTLMEEPDSDVYSDRKLQRMGNSMSA